MHQNPDADLFPLIQGCLERDPESQRLLYRRFYGYGMSICLRYADDEDEAIHILNDSFLKVFNNLKKYDPERPFKGWFRVILINTAINHIRQNKKHKFLAGMDEAQHIATEESILSKIGYQELLAMVQSLSLAYRTVFNLYVIDGFKHEEIAAQLGITVGTSKSNLSKARERLKELVIEKLKTRNV